MWSYHNCFNKPLGTRNSADKDKELNKVREIETGVPILSATKAMLDWAISAGLNLWDFLKNVLPEVLSGTTHYFMEERENGSQEKMQWIVFWIHNGITMFCI